MKQKSIMSFIAYPALIWFLLFILFPITIVFIISFASRGTYGNIEWAFQLNNFYEAFNVTYFEIFLKSFFMAFLTASFSIFFGFFIAWSIATADFRNRNYLLLAMILPFLTNLVIRIYAIKTFVGREGPLQYVLELLGFQIDPYYFTSNIYLVAYGLLTAYLPFAVFPLYSAIDKMDFSLVEAAYDLGANNFQVIKNILLPQLKIPILNAFSLVFVPCLGEYVIPDLLGGAKQMFLGNLIVEFFLKARNWPLGSAISVYIFVILILFFVMVKVLKGKADAK